MVINFGNGFRAGTSERERTNGVSGAISDHSGVEYPEIELRGLESTLRDGGTIFGSRAPMRRMSFRVDFRGYTRRELTVAFQQGQTYTLSSPRGSISAVLDRIGFTSENLHNTTMTLSYVSPDPYPTSPAVLIEAGTSTVSGYEYAYEYPYSYDGYDAATSLHFEASTEVNADPIVSVTLATGGAQLVVTLGNTFTLDWSLDGGDVVVINSDTRTVTVNGVNALEGIDITSGWPVIVAGNNTVTTSLSAVTQVSFSPRLVGLL